MVILGGGGVEVSLSVSRLTHTPLGPSMWYHLLLTLHSASHCYKLKEDFVVIYMGCCFYLLSGFDLIRVWSSHFSFESVFGILRFSACSEFIFLLICLY